MHYAFIYIVFVSDKVLLSIFIFVYTTDSLISNYQFIELQMRLNLDPFQNRKVLSTYKQRRVVNKKKSTISKIKNEMNSWKCYNLLIRSSCKITKDEKKILLNKLKYKI